MTRADASRGGAARPRLPEVRFATARGNILREWKRTRKWPDQLDAALKRSKIYELLNENKPDNEFSALLQYAVVGMYYSSAEIASYTWLMSELGIELGVQAESGPVSEHITGSYHYYRSFWNNAGAFAVRRGAIMITKEEGVCRFKHRSADAPDLNKYEDTGFAFGINGRLFMLAMRPGNIRLGIAAIPEDRRHEPFAGIVLSTRKRDQSVFSSAFIMFHEKNRAFSGELDEARYSEILREKGLCVDGDAAATISFLEQGLHAP